VKPPPFAYHAPTDVDEAIALLAELGEDGKVLAGGQSLVPMMNLRLATPAAVVDISRLDALSDVEVADGSIRVGAAVTAERLRTHADATAACPLLRQALDLVAHAVIRNRGTAVGSLAHADPAAELPAVFALLDATIELRSQAGTRTITGSDLFVGVLQSDIRDDELAVAATFPALGQRTGTAFHELARRHGDYALAGIGVTVDLDDDRVASARAVAIGVADQPVVVHLDEVLGGQEAASLDVAEAAASVRGAIDPSDDIHASGSYRRHLAGVLCGRALTEAATRAATRAAGSKETA
jgi:aerobic carbon-monoxide dehydrogenase medium subunit